MQFMKAVMRLLRDDINILSACVICHCAVVRDFFLFFFLLLFLNVSCATVWPSAWSH